MLKDQLKTIRDKIEHLVFVPRFNDDELNYSVLGSINERALEIIRLLDKLLEELE